MLPQTYGPMKHNGEICQSMTYCIWYICYISILYIHIYHIVPAMHFLVCCSSKAIPRFPFFRCDIFLQHFHPLVLAPSFLGFPTIHFPPSIPPIPTLHTPHSFIQTPTFICAPALLSQARNIIAKSANTHTTTMHVKPRNIKSTYLHIS